MIDYLTLLLELQEREEETETPDWSVLDRERAVKQAGMQTEREVPPMETAATDIGAAARTAAAAVMGGTIDFDEQENRIGTPGLAEMLLGVTTGTNGDLAATGSRTGGAERLYQQVRRSRTQAGYSRPVSNTVPLTVSGFQAEPRSVDPEGLDRIFRRDARRYDGGFTLF